jgi:uncharacterized protein (UPF0548 family)
MFLARRPSDSEIEKFIRQSSRLPLSYKQIGIARDEHVSGFKHDKASAIIARGPDAFEKAKLALTRWRHFDLGWVELFPHEALIEPGTVVAVLVHHFGFWSLNGCRVVYVINDRESLFGFAYGTLNNHAECGEEIFEVSMAPESEEVTYRIRAVSKPRARLAQIGYPITRTLQARFRRYSNLALQRAIGTPSPSGR